MNSKEELFKLIKEHPELPVVPIVESTLTKESAQLWGVGKLRLVEIDEYVIINGNVYNKLSYEKRDVIAAAYGDDKVSGMTNKEVEKKYQKLSWIKAIMLYVAE